MVEDIKKTLIFAGDWAFTASQFATLYQDRLDELLASITLEASVRFNNDTDTFSIECQPDMAEKISQTILANISLFKEHRDDEGSNEDKEPLVQITTRGKSHVTTNDCPSSLDDLRGLIIDNEQKSPISGHQFWTKISWSYQGPDTLQAVLPLPTLEHLKRLTSCEITRSSSSEKLHVSGPSVEVCNQIIHKLDGNCMTYVRLPQTNKSEELLNIPQEKTKASIKNVLQCEERTRFHVVAKRLKYFGNMLQTTLIDGIISPIPIHMLGKTFVLRCWELEDKVETDISKKPDPAVEEKDKANLLKIWKTYKYRAKGESRNYPGGQDTGQEVEEKSTQQENESEKRMDIQNWADQLPGAKETKEQLERDLVRTVSHQEDLLAMVLPDVDDVQQETLIDTLQEDDEVNSREYHETMRQKASRGGSSNRGSPSKRQNSWTAPMPAANAKQSFVKEPLRNEMDDHLAKILDSMRFWDGNVKLEVEFGRILILDAQNGASANGNMANSQICKIAHLYLSELVERGPCIYMTRSLTTLEADAQYVVDLKDEQGCRYWSVGRKGTPEPEVDVIYELRCEDQRTRTHFVIEINAQTFDFTVRTIPSELGVINSHCLLRNWDCRVVATGTKDLGLIYGHLARMIVDSLYIPSELERPELYFELDSRQEYNFTSIRTYRRCKFARMRGPEVLNITQVFDMNVNKMIKPGGTKVYRAYNPPLKDPTSPMDEPMWIEMSISSSKAETYLKENRTMTRGQEASWKVDDLLEGGTVASLYLVAFTLLRKMDGVGFYNHNGRISPGHQPKPSKEQEEPFW